MAKWEYLHALQKPQSHSHSCPGAQARLLAHNCLGGNTEPAVDLVQALPEARAITDFQVQPPKDPSVPLYGAPEPFPLPHLRQGFPLRCTGSSNFNSCPLSNPIFCSTYVTQHQTPQPRAGKEYLNPRVNAFPHTSGEEVVWDLRKSPSSLATTPLGDHNQQTGPRPVP